MESSTSDSDNDAEMDVNCAAQYGGGNWWADCGFNNINNGKYEGNGDIGSDFMWWYRFDNNDMAFESLTLMFRRAD